MIQKTSKQVVMETKLSADELSSPHTIDVKDLQGDTNENVNDDFRWEKNNGEVQKDVQEVNSDDGYESEDINEDVVEDINRGISEFVPEDVLKGDDTMLPVNIPRSVANRRHLLPTTGTCVSTQPRNCLDGHTTLDEIVHLSGRQSLMTSNAFPRANFRNLYLKKIEWVLVDRRNWNWEQTTLDLDISKLLTTQSPTNWHSFSEASQRDLLLGTLARAPVQQWNSMGDQTMILQFYPFGVMSVNNYYVFSEASRRHLLLGTQTRAPVQQWNSMGDQTTILQFYNPFGVMSMNNYYVFPGANWSNLHQEIISWVLVELRNWTGEQTTHDLVIFEVSARQSPINWFSFNFGKIYQLSSLVLSTGNSIWSLVQSRRLDGDILPYFHANGGDSRDHSDNYMALTGAGSFDCPVSVNEEPINGHINWYRFGEEHSNARNGHYQEVPQAIPQGNFSDNNSKESSLQTRGKTRFVETDSLSFSGVSNNDTYPVRSHENPCSNRNTKDNIAVSLTAAKLCIPALEVAVNGQSNGDSVVQLTDPASYHLSRPVQEHFDTSSDIDLRLTARETNPTGVLATDVDLHSVAVGNNPPHQIATDVAIHASEDGHELNILGVIVRTGTGSRNFDTSSYIDLRLTARGSNPTGLLATDVDLHSAASRSNPPQQIATGVAFHTADNRDDLNSLGVSVKNRNWEQNWKPLAQQRCARCLQRPIQTTNLPCNCSCYCTRCVGITPRCASCSCRITDFVRR